MSISSRFFRWSGAAPIALAALFSPISPATAPAQPLVVYDDALRNGFQDWSWAVHDLEATAYVHAGSFAISMTPAGWAGLYFHHPGFDVESNGSLEFWIHGGAAGGQQLRIYLYSDLQPIADAALESFVEGGTIPAGHWARATVPFSALGITGGSIDGLVFQADAALAQPEVYFDSLTLLETAGPTPPVTVTVDPFADRRAISPLIYGVNFGSPEEDGSLPYPLRRWGGNSVSRYNWQKDATNHASDWFYINLPEGPDSTNLPSGSAVDVWIDETLASGAEAILTVPTIGWTARDRVKRWGFSIAKYGPQQENECTASGWPSWCEPDAGNGVRLDGTPVTGNDPHDTSIEIGPSFVSAWLQHIINRVGPSPAGGVALYALDNEPALWNSTHRDIHPSPVNLDELWSRTVAYAEAVKAADPAAQVLGPVAWGWCEYFYSASDGCRPGPDMAAHGGLPLLEWYLARNRERELQSGVRPVDYLDVHYYPQSANVALTDDESVAAVRLRSLRSLYDPAYVDESWIGQPIRLIPRLREWIDARCPGVKLAITEYNWGGDQGISSALAQAEALAIFGREGVDLATRWVAPQAPSRVHDAFRIYLDYDGAGHHLAGESIRAISSDVNDVGAYAILRDGGSETAVLLFNKAAGARTVQLSVAGAGSGPAPIYRLDATSPLGPAGEVTMADGTCTLELPSRSATVALIALSGASAAGGGSPGDPPETKPPGDGDGSPLAATAVPTPFRASTLIRYRLPRAAATSIDLIDVRGRVVRRLLESRAETAGWQAIAWDGYDRSGSAAPSGIYFARVRSGDRVTSARLLKLE